MGHLDVIAENIYNNEFYAEVATPEEIAAFKTRISAWLETNIGQLNILLNTSFRVDSSNNVSPALMDEEIAIFMQLYLKAHYKRESQNILKNLSSSTYTTPSTSVTTMSDWTELREGDSSIRRVAQVSSPQQKVQVAQTYKTFSEEADIKLSELVHSYNMYRSRPRQVVSLEAGASECEIKNVEETPTATAASSGSSVNNNEAFDPFFSAQNE
jgi:hypothetical protein